MLVFIGRLSLSTLKWVPMCQGFSHFSGILHHFVFSQVSHQQHKAYVPILSVLIFNRFPTLFNVLCIMIFSLRSRSYRDSWTLRKSVRWSCRVIAIVSTLLCSRWKSEKLCARIRGRQSDRENGSDSAIANGSESKRDNDRWGNVNQRNDYNS